MNQKKIAQIAGVSTATVSRVINNDVKVTEKTRKRVLKAIEDNAYVQNLNARNLRSARTNTIGFLISNLTNPFFIQVYSGLEPICKRDGYNIIIGNTDENEGQEAKSLDLFLSYRVDGIVASFVRPSDAMIAKLKNYNMQVVMLDRKIGNFTADSVGIDSVGGAREQVLYLAGLGHTRIAAIHGTDYDSPGIDRMEGFYQGMNEAGIRVRQEYLACGAHLEEAAYTATIELMNLPKPPTGIVAHNNLMCIGAYKALSDLKVKIPEEVSLIGFDDFELSSRLQPGITLMDRPTREMGELAAKMIIDRIEDRYSGPCKEVVFPVKLKTRGSCAAPRA